MHIVHLSNTNILYPNITEQTLDDFPATGTTTSTAVGDARRTAVKKEHPFLAPRPQKTFDAFAQCNKRIIIHAIRRPRTAAALRHATILHPESLHAEERKHTRVS